MRRDKTHFFLFPLLLLCVAGCLSPASAPESSDSIPANTLSDSGLDFVPTDTLAVSTDYIFDPTFQLPTGYFLDTLRVNDTVYNGYYIAYYVQSNDQRKTAFNSKMRGVVQDLIDRELMWYELESEYPPPGMGMEWELGPFELNIVDSTFSLTFIIDTYSGGNHHNYSWYTFNYDFRHEKILQFQNVFRIPTEQDTVGFSELVLRHQVEPKMCMDWGAPFDSVDFSFVKRGICINPELSWACGMQRSFVPFDSVKPYLVPRFQNIK